ncbi:MAG TPA: hypothetical protein VM120_14885 [Bryobacteraceae bacterium]|nr:hypothetical protein [Bryobacteraceae bacterium]
MKVCVLTALLSGASLYGQTVQGTQIPPPSPPPAAAEKPAAPVKPVLAADQVMLQRGTYIRRFSAGASLTVIGLGYIKNRDTSTLTSTPPVDALYSTTGVSRRIGFGITAQIAVTERFAVNGNLFVRPRIGYTMNSDVVTGVDNPTTPADDRRRTTSREDTRARLYELPVTIRYFGKGRHERGARWFVEGGGAVRRVVNIKTTTITQVGSAAPVTTNVPAPATRSIRGLVAGMGVYVIDPIGVRIVPEVRYTRWMGTTFNSFSTITLRNQIEAIVSLTF